MKKILTGIFVLFIFAAVSGAVLRQTDAQQASINCRIFTDSWFPAVEAYDDGCGSPGAQKQKVSVDGVIFEAVFGFLTELTPDWDEFAKTDAATAGDVELLSLASFGVKGSRIIISKDEQGNERQIVNAAYRVRFNNCATDLLISGTGPENVLYYGNEVIRAADAKIRENTKKMKGFAVCYSQSAPPPIVPSAPAVKPSPGASLPPVVTFTPTPTQALTPTSVQNQITKPPEQPPAQQPKQPDQTPKVTPTLQDEFDVDALRKTMADLGKKLGEVKEKLREASAIEEYLREQSRVAVGADKQSVKKQLFDAYIERKSYTAEYYQVLSEYNKAQEKLQQAEERAQAERRSQWERQLVSKLVENDEKREKERRAIEERLVERREFFTFQEKKRAGEIPGSDRYDEKVCRAGEKMAEAYECKYFIPQPPTFFKHDTYTLSESNLEGLRSVFDKIGLASFAVATFWEGPAALEVMKFVAGEMTGVPVITSFDDIISLTSDLLPDVLLDGIKLIQAKLGLVYQISVPVTIKTIDVEKNYTSKSAGLCRAVTWDSKTEARLSDTETVMVDFVCQGVGNNYTASLGAYDATFSFGNSAEKEKLYYHCKPPKDPAVFAAILQELAGEAMRIAGADIINDSRCPAQRL